MPLHDGDEHVVDAEDGELAPHVATPARRPQHRAVSRVGAARATVMPTYTKRDLDVSPETEVILRASEMMEKPSRTVAGGHL
ncbi:hypothetical protein [Streptomyces sp. NBC_01465]|uniref:hypothetical protein n=1 Tax=Streptomyces sp. NBC_01465 TaxID=2903878 RepID=UPI002E337B0C|nr:hypothetical protein [Streptomyces sp. NBC_01465]